MSNRNFKSKYIKNIVKIDDEDSNMNPSTNP